MNGPQQSGKPGTAAAVRPAAEMETHAYGTAEEIAAASEAAAQILGAWMDAQLRATPEPEIEVC